MHKDTESWRRMIRTALGRTAIALASLIILFNTPSFSSQLPEPEGKVILTMSGRLSNHNGRGEIRFDRAMLKAIGMHELVTRSAKSDAILKYRGILLRDLIAYAGAKGDHLELSAMDGYQCVIPMEDIETFDVLMAMEKSGIPLTIRTRGPLRIIYPIEKLPQNSIRVYTPRMIWQITSITVK